MFVTSSYRHDEEDVARPSVSQTTAVTSPQCIMLRVLTNAPVLLLLEFGQEVRNVVGF